jgi:hypothetical protein
LGSRIKKLGFEKELYQEAAQKMVGWEAGVAGN